VTHNSSINRNRLSGEDVFSFTKLSDTQREFFKEASYELQRIQQQTRYEGELAKLEDEIQYLQTQLQHKDRIIHILKETVQQRNEMITFTTGLSEVPKEFLTNWIALEKAIRMNNTFPSPSNGTLTSSSTQQTTNARPTSTQQHD